MAELVCPLCLQNNHFTALLTQRGVQAYLCEECLLIFKEQSARPSPEDEKARYLTHNNGIQYPGYVNFLNQAILPAISFLESGMQGLDYGCGPVPTLSLLLKERGLMCDDYDPFFFPKISKDKEYDFIFATECCEHFFRPREDLRRIYGLLKMGGVLIVMTDLRGEQEDFSSWNYTNDETHVCFYHHKTIEYIAALFPFQILHTDHKRVVVLRKKSEPI